MSEHPIQRALAALGARGTGLESFSSSGPALERADSLAEEAAAALPPPLPGSAPLEQARFALASALLQEGRTGLRELATHGAKAALSGEQLAGLEAIVRLTGRPSLLIRDGTVQEITAEWTDVFELSKDIVEQSIRGVGRLRVPEFSDPLLGTAFRVGSDLALTNIHVAIQFAERSGTRWRLGTGLTPIVDFLAEDGRPGRCEFRVTGIACLHPDPRLDLAVLRLASTGEHGQALPPPMPLNGDPTRLRPGGRLYVIGYPAADDRHDVAVVDAIFGRSLFVKRLAPGEILAVREHRLEFTHDCSTLKGNSGSCVLDLGSHRVLGLHRSGTAGLENRAASMAHAREDARLLDLGLQFQA